VVLFGNSAILHRNRGVFHADTLRDVVVTNLMLPLKRRHPQPVLGKVFWRHGFVSS